LRAARRLFRKGGTVSRPEKHTAALVVSPLSLHLTIKSILPKYLFLSVSAFSGQIPLTPKKGYNQVALVVNLRYVILCSVGLLFEICVYVVICHFAKQILTNKLNQIIIDKIYGGR
jgi:hypothetical protein